MSNLNKSPEDPAFYKELLDHMSDGVYFVDRNRCILYWNEGASRLSGYRAEEMLGRHCQDNILCHVDDAGKHLCAEGCPLSASIHDGGLHEANVFLRHKQGRRVPVNVRVQPMRSSDGSIIGAIEIFSDDSAQHEVRRQKAAMERLAFLDHLTDLPNRRYMEMSLKTAIDEYGVHKDPFGVLLFDLDRFKEINDSFGHSSGDLALQEVAKTLSGSLRPTDTVGRLGGDEFIAILRNVDSSKLKRLAERCVALVRETSIVSGDGRSIHLSVSVGAVLSHLGQSAEKLLERADELMYRSKASGRSCTSTE